MDASNRAEELMKRNIEAMMVPAVERELEQLALEAVEFIPECKDCPQKHPQPMVYREEEKAGVKHRIAISLFPTGRLMVLREKLLEGSPLVMGHGQPATVDNIVKAGFQVREVVNGIYLFVEQEKILRMCGGMKPALC